MADSTYFPRRFPMSATRGTLALALFAFLAAGSEAQTLQYRAVGARNDNTAVTGKAATVVICTNIGITDDMYVEFFGFTGSSVCSVGALDSTPGNTYVFATQPVELFPSASVCGDPGPSINQGVVEISGYTTVACSVLLVDPNGNPPAFLSALELVKLN